MNKHYQSFFGKNCALILNSNYETEEIFLNFIQKLNENQWEKYREGLNLKLTLKEICNINYVLEAGNGSTKLIHNYQGLKKDFWLGFEKKQSDIVFSVKGRAKNISENKEIRSHQKSFYKGELRLLTKLLTHIENEFIEFTTQSKIMQKNDSKIN